MNRVSSDALADIARAFEARDALAERRRARIALYVDCCRRAHYLWREWRRSATEWPSYREHDLAEADKCFERARRHLRYAQEIRDGRRS